MKYSKAINKVRAFMWSRELARSTFSLDYDARIDFETKFDAKLKKAVKFYCSPEGRK